MEVWKTLNRIPRYEVSTKGNVRSIQKDGTPKLLKQSTSNSGYKLVCLSGHGKLNTSYVHRLVAEVFIPVDDVNNRIVNHKDRDKTNNTVDNLEWVTMMENLLHWTDNDRYTIIQQIRKKCGEASLAQLKQIAEFCNAIE